MEQVVLFCRVSTQIQDYERQVSDLTLLAKRHNWNIAETFTEKVSGAKKNEERKELTALLAYVRAYALFLCMLFSVLFVVFVGKL